MPTKIKERTTTTTIVADAGAKIKKILKGATFEPRSCVDELVQNAQRAKATELIIEVTENNLIVRDNGCGCDEPSSLLTLDHSGWSTTEEGFGMGFWSTLVFPHMKTVTVSSNGWRAVIEKEKLINGNLSLDVEDIPYESGFQIEIEAENIDVVSWKLHFEKVLEHISLASQINGNPVLYKSVLDLPPVYNEIYRKIFDNDLFTAVLIAVKHSAWCSAVYYEGRKVTDLWLLSGKNTDTIIELKKGAVNLKEPDRKSIIADDKRDAFYEKLNECAQQLWTEYVMVHGVDDPDAIDGIKRWVPVEIYEPYLTLPNLSVSSPTNSAENDTEENTVSDEQIIDAVESAADVSIVCSKEDECRSNTPYIPSENKLTKPKKAKFSLKKYLREKEAIVWVAINEVDKYNDVIANVRYNGIMVFISPNVLYDEVLKSENIPYIEDVKDCMEVTHSFTEIKCATLKEKNFLALLEPIRKEFMLPSDVFLICDISRKVSFTKKDGTQIVCNSLQNKKGNIQLYGAADGYHIYLDRKALGLSKYNIRKGAFSFQEFKAIAANANTIAHELSHYLYGTTDDTVEHYHNEVSIMRRIMELYGC